MLHQVLIFLLLIQCVILYIYILILLNVLVSPQYPSEQHIINDFELMFNNARLYNEEDSLVYQDADQLERVLKTRWKQVCHVIESRRAALSKRYQ